MKWLPNLRNFGPGLLVTAAFIGPGTLTTATRAGANYGFALLWAVAFSVVTAIILQEMAARLGLVGRTDLGRAIATTFRRRGTKIAAAGLVLTAIAAGNAAYQAGNISGAVLGVDLIFAPREAGPAAGWRTPFWALLIGGTAAGLLVIGVYRIIERVLIALVMLMSSVFLITAVYVLPGLGPLLEGLFVPYVPSTPDGAWLTVIALVGTTVVPYNLFLHSAAVREKWPESMSVGSAMREARADTVLSVGLGGMITLAVVVTAAAMATSIESPSQMAASLEPLLGSLARPVFAIGILAAGLTSAITAPLAAAYATSGVLGWEPDLKSWRFRAVWITILVIGTFFAAVGRKPTEAIVLAQAVNGILLPITAAFLLLVMNRGDLLGERCNRAWANLAGVTVVLIAAGLGGYNLVKAILSAWS